MLFYVKQLYLNRGIMQLQLWHLIYQHANGNYHCMSIVLTPSALHYKCDEFIYLFNHLIAFAFQSGFQHWAFPTVCNLLVQCISVILFFFHKVWGLHLIPQPLPQQSFQPSTDTTRKPSKITFSEYAIWYQNIDIGAFTNWSFLQDGRKLR